MFVSSLFLPFPLFSSLFPLPCLLLLQQIHQVFEFFFSNLPLMAVSPEDVLLHTVVSKSGVFPNSCQNLPGNQGVNIRAWCSCTRGSDLMGQCPPSEAGVCHLRDTHRCRVSFVTQVQLSWARWAGAVPGAGWLLLLTAQRAWAAQRDSVPCLHGCLCQRLSLCSWGREEGVSLLAFLLLSACSWAFPCHSQEPLFPQRGSGGVSRDGGVRQTWGLTWPV